MKKITNRIKLFLMEDTYCPHCREYVKANIKRDRKDGKIVEIKICSQCGRILEKRILEEEFTR